MRTLECDNCGEVKGNIIYSYKGKNLCYNCKLKVYLKELRNENV